MATIASGSTVALSGELLLARYRQVRGTTLRLAAPLSAEDAMVQSMPDASPAKWHMAHTTWFFETFLLSAHGAGYREFDPAYRLLFNSYYKSLGGHPVRAQRGSFSRPALFTVLRYREHVDEAMERWLATEPAPELLQLAELGLHHEQQHQELLLTDILHAFWTQPLRPAYAADGSPGALGSLTRDAAPPLRWVHHAGGVAECGAEAQGFAFDNERPRHPVMLAPYRLASRLSTNAEYLDFIADGGYRRPELWLSDGWDTVCRDGWTAPFYWENCEGCWLHFGLHGMSELDPAAPVTHLSYFEADAFARWSGARLPTEAEWEQAANAQPVAGNLLDDWQLEALPANDAGLHEAQLFGDVWEWTASAYLAYPGFHPAAGAVGEYNGKFMCNQFVLRGGSFATSASHIRASYRNFFPPQARWQFMGVRLAMDEERAR